MPKRSSPKRTRSRTRRQTGSRVRNRPARAPRRAPVVIVIECDADKLKRDGIQIGERLGSRAGWGGVGVRYLRVTDSRSLLDGLAALTDDHTLQVRLVVIVGHSSPDGLQVASDHFASWAAVGRWIRPVAPKRVFLVACKAGRRPSCAVLFEEVPGLREIYASPLLLNSNQVELPSLLLPVLARPGTIDVDLHRVLLGINFVTTRGLIVRRTRADHEATDGRTEALWTQLEDLGAELLATRGPRD